MNLQGSPASVLAGKRDVAHIDAFAPRSPALCALALGFGARVEQIAVQIIQRTIGSHPHASEAVR
jgi:hypothetical protein